MLGDIAVGQTEYLKNKLEKYQCFTVKSLNKICLQLYMFLCSYRKTAAVEKTALIKWQVMC